MTTSPPPRPAAGLARDLNALRRYVWLPAASIIVAVVAALAIGAVRPASSDAQFRTNVIVDALPPLFGPAVLPSPFDYARLATSDGVVEDVAQRTGTSADLVRPRLTATASFNRPEIDFTVTGGNALPVARAWQQAFADAASKQSGDLERLLVIPYARQLDEARAQLNQASADSTSRPDDAAAKQQLTAAQENYETASKLSQSYEVVALTMKATALTVTGPHVRSAGIGSTAGRLGIAVAAGLLAGIIAALVLDYARRDARDAYVVEETPVADEPPAEFPRRRRRDSASM